MPLQKIGEGESSIPSLDINWADVQKEIQDIDDKYNNKPQKPLRLSRQSSGNMYSTKNQHRIGFLEDESEQIELKKAEVIDPITSSNLSSIFDPENRLQGNSSVRSAACHSEGITDMGGPSKYIKSETSPSIWDNDKLTRMLDIPDNKEKTLQEKQNIVDSRQAMKDERLDLLASGLTGVDQRKSSTVILAGDQTVSEEQSRFNAPTKNLSIFDFMGDKQTKEFNRLPETTGGEKISKQRAEESSQQDESWREHRPLTSNTSILDNMFESFTEGQK